MLVLDDGRASAEVHPETGAAIGRYDLFRADGSVVPVFQTGPHQSRFGPYALGLNLLVPFSNRISGGGFRHDGAFHRLERNGPGPYPIHGNGLSESWTVADSTERSATLELRSTGPGSFRYDAQIHYRLDEGALSASLRVVNWAGMALPYGAGFHPWFVRTPQAKLTLHADGFWTETHDHLPDTYHRTAGDPVFDFSSGRTLPSAFTNTVLTGWQGRAVLDWPETGGGVEIEAAKPLTKLIIYSPSIEADFICIEPVSQSVDGHNMSGPGVSPPQVLRPRDTLDVGIRITPYHSRL
jgi:aldose 1-epimerase